MATFTFTFTVPDEQMARVDSALHKHFGPVIEEVAPATEGDKGTFASRPRTKEELQEAIVGMVGQRIREIIAKVEAAEAADAAAQSVHNTIVDVKMS